MCKIKTLSQRCSNEDSFDNYKQREDFLIKSIKLYPALFCIHSRVIKPAYRQKFKGKLKGIDQILQKTICLLWFSYTVKDANDRRQKFGWSHNGINHFKEMQCIQLGVINNHRMSLINVTSFKNMDLKFQLFC